jgi:hypothetical protein
MFLRNDDDLYYSVFYLKRLQIYTNLDIKNQAMVPEKELKQKSY